VFTPQISTFPVKRNPPVVRGAVSRPVGMPIRRPALPSPDAGRKLGAMGRAGWRLGLWALLWAACPAVIAASRPDAVDALAIAGLGAVVGAAALGALAFGLRPEGLAPPPWRPGVAVGAALLAAALAGIGLAAAGRPLLGLPAAAALGLYQYWTARGLPPGFAPRLSGAARCAVLGAAALGAVALRPAVLLGLPSAGLGAAAYVGVGPIGAGPLLWEQARPALAARRRG